MYLRTFFDRAVHPFANPSEFSEAPNVYYFVETRFGCDAAVSQATPALASPEAEGATSRVLKPLTLDERTLFTKTLHESPRLLEVFQEAVRELHMDMSPVYVHPLAGEPKLVCFYTAIGRVDFRELVSVLAHRTKKRIQMHQISTREAAAWIGGIGICGRPTCCHQMGLSACHLCEKRPRTSNDPERTKGICGACRCCVRYETKDP